MHVEIGERLCPPCLYPHRVQVMLRSGWVKHQHDRPRRHVRGYAIKAARLPLFVRPNNDLRLMGICDSSSNLASIRLLAFFVAELNDLS